MNLFFVSRTLKYFFLARHRRGHGIHSPFVFNLFSEIFLNKPDPEIVKSIVDFKYHFRNSLDISGYHESVWRRTGYFRGYNKYDRLLVLLAGRIKGLPVVQLGVDYCMTPVAFALGITGCPLVLGDEMKDLEGEVERLFIRDRARSEDAAIDTDVITDMVVVNDIKRLGHIIGETGKIGLAMIAADRCSEQLLYCFDTVAEVATGETMVVVRDIHKSANIENDWHKMINDKRVSVSIDLLRYGILFFKYGISKQNFLIRY